MVLRNTLNTEVPWSSLADLLGIHCRSAALPVRVVCPACDAPRLNVYEDSITGGQWHYCAGCHSTGDMIELAAAAWDVPVEDAVRRLAENGFDLPVGYEEVANYALCHPARRKKMEAFWEDSKRRYAGADTRSVADLKARFRLNHQLSPERFAAGPGSMVGWADRRTAAAMFGYHKQTCGKVFPGRHWKDVLVLPYHTAPGRLSGFLFVGREGGPKDRVFKNYGDLKNAPSAEAGLFGLQTLEGSPPEFVSHVFAVEDPLTALRLQYRHFVSSSRPLPVVSWHDGGKALTAESWSAVGNRRPIFWGFSLTAAMLHQAIRCDGLLYVVALKENTKESVDHYFRLGPPRDILKRAVRLARPWREVLASWSEGDRAGEVRELLFGLERYGLDPTEIANGIGLRAESVVEGRAVRTARVGDKLVIERECGWYCRTHTGKEGILSEAMLRIDRVVGGERPRYEGVITYRGVVVPFSAAGKDVETTKSVKRLIVSVCSSAGLGRPAMPCGLRMPSLIDVAIAFHRPDGVMPV